MAEATLTTQVEADTGPTQSEVEIPAVLNPTQEAAPEQQQQEPVIEDNFDDVLALLDEPLDGESDKTATSTTTTAPVQKTPEELEQEAEQRVTARLNQQLEQRQRTNRIAGMRESWTKFDEEMTNILKDMGIIDVDSQKRIKDRVAIDRGHFNELYQNDVTQAHSVGVEGVRAGIIQGVAAIVGQDTAESIRQANHPTWDAYLEDFGSRYAAKKGLKTEGEVKAAVKDGQTALLKRLEKMGVKVPRGGEGQKIGAAKVGPSGNTFRTKQEARAIYRQGRESGNPTLSSNDMKRIEADPSIPEQ